MGASDRERDAGRAWYSSASLWFALASLNALPILLVPLPMMPDFFNHVGRYFVMLHQDDALLRSYYAFHPELVSNSGVDLVMLVLGKFLPVEQAARLAVAGIAAGLTLGIYAFARSAHGRVPATALLAVPFVWSFPFVFGFLNFCLGLALALAGAALWLSARNSRLPIRAAIDVPLAFAIWLTHLVAFGIFLIICASFVAGRLLEQRNSGAWRRAIADLALLGWPLLLALIPHGPSVPLFSGQWDLKVKAGLALQLFRSISKIVDRGTIAILAACAIGLLVLARSGQVRFRHPVLGASMVLACLWVVLPEAMMGSFYSDLRLLPAVFILFFLGAAITSGRLANLVAAIALLLVVARLTLVTVDWRARSHEAQLDLGALAFVPEGARIAVFAADSGCSDWRLSSHDTLASLAIDRRRAFVNTEWDIPGASWMRPLYNQNRGYDDNLSVQIANPAFVRCDAPNLTDRLDKLPRDRFDFVWIFDAPLRGDAYPWLTKRFSGPAATLYVIERSPVQ